MNKCTRHRCFFSEYDPEALEKIIETQFRVAEQMKKGQGKHVYNVGHILHAQGGRGAAPRSADATVRLALSSSDSWS